MKKKPANPRSYDPTKCKCIHDRNEALAVHGVEISTACMMLILDPVSTVYGFPLQPKGGGKATRSMPRLVQFSHCPFCGTEL
jgi:hypothetical protein